MDEIKLLSALSESDDPEERRNAAQAIVSAGSYSDESLKSLAHGLMDQDIGVRDVCFLGLLNVPDEIKHSSAKHVSEFISSDDIEVRNLAGDLMIKLGRDSAKVLVPFLESDDPDVLKYACDILGIIDDTDVIENIYPLLRNYDANVRASAVEALGNLGDTKALEHLFGIYDIDESIQPNVVESIGKIGGPEAQEFLLSKLQTEDDIFLQTSCIDALAHAGSDFSICEQLMEELPNAPAEIQSYVLIAIFAIAFRLEMKIKLPYRLRYVAQNALMDEDPDTRAAGLIALGDDYLEEDVDGLINEIMTNNAETQQLIIFNLLVNSAPESVSKFFHTLYHKADIDTSFVDLIGLIGMFHEDSPRENISRAINSIITEAVINPKGYSTEFIELLIKIDAEEVILSSKGLFVSCDKEAIANLLDLIQQMGADNFREELELISAAGDENSDKAQELLVD